MTRSAFLKSCVFAAAAAALSAFAAPASAQDVGACLITKTDTNPFFVKMKEGATAKAKELGVNLKAYAGKIDGDNESQVAAIESCIADGAKGILLVPSDSKAIVDSVKKARDAGILVIALDTPLEPIDAADCHLRHRQFQGRRADRLMGEGDPRRRRQGRQDRLSWTSTRASRPSTSCATRAS